jgi:hypothetical protein
MSVKLYSTISAFLSQTLWSEYLLWRYWLWCSARVPILRAFTYSAPPTMIGITPVTVTFLAQEIRRRAARQIPKGPPGSCSRVSHGADHVPAITGTSPDGSGAIQPLHGRMVQICTNEWTGNPDVIWQRKHAFPSDGSAIGDNITNRGRVTGTSLTYTLKRLKKKKPDLNDRSRAKWCRPCPTNLSDIPDGRQKCSRLVEHLPVQTARHLRMNCRP